MKQVLSFSNRDLLYEDRKLSEVALINPSSTVPSEFEYVDLESVSGTEMIRHRLERKETAPSRAQRLAKRGDIFYQTVRPYQKNNYFFDMDEDNYVFSTGYAQIRPQINGKYLFTLLQSDAFLGQVLDYCAGTSFPAINPSILSNLLIRVCTNQREQELIANFFVYYDNIISTASSRLASLKQVKEASLQAMFPQKGETVPKIRFKGFEGEWEEVKLKDISTKVIEKNRLNNISITLTNSAEYGIINQRDFFDHDVSNTDNVSGYFIVQPNDFVYNPRISTLAPVGPINMNKLGYAGVVSPLYYVFRVTGFNKSFLDIYFHTNVWHKFMKDNGNTGARFDRLSISNELFYEMPIYCPRDENEQQQIASYFTSLDKQITFQTQRLEKLRQIKAACLDKMFV
ncbi:restriction endonuclease subunit S [Prevotella jejuni]|uniref:restriction endonuclease subunit S n=1 Tax=Prevotella jejuni TaxID=1177574 RepID=UPI003211C13A